MSVEDKKVPLWNTPVIDSQEFGKFVEEVYGQKFSGVSGIDTDYITGNGSMMWIGLEQWLYDQEDEDYGLGPSVDEEFDRWMALEGWDAYNQSPTPEVLFIKLRNDGYEVPDEFQYHVWW